VSLSVGNEVWRLSVPWGGERWRDVVLRVDLAKPVGLCDGGDGGVIMMVLQVLTHEF